MLTLKKYSGITVLETETVINASLDQVWDFFSSPRNLETITPSSMNFRITGTDWEKESYAGQIISYKVSPFPALRVNWVTEITHLEKHRIFTDEQRFGPYKFWHHRHIFERSGQNTIMRDIVTYKLPGGFAGRLISRLFVDGRIKEIFNYREIRIKEIFR